MLQGKYKTRPWDQPQRYPNAVYEESLDGTLGQSLLIVTSLDDTSDFVDCEGPYFIIFIIQSRPTWSKCSHQGPSLIVRRSRFIGWRQRFWGTRSCKFLYLIDDTLAWVSSSKPVHRQYFYQRPFSDWRHYWNNRISTGQSFTVCHLYSVRCLM